MVRLWFGIPNCAKKTGYEVVNKISTSIIPVYDLPQVAPTAHVHLSMLELSDLGNWDEAKGLLALENEYQNGLIRSN